MRKNIKLAAFLAIVSSVGIYEAHAKTLMCPDTSDIHPTGHDKNGYHYHATPSEGDIKLRYTGNSSHNLIPNQSFSGLDLAPNITKDRVTCAYRGHIGIPGLPLYGTYPDAEKKCTLSNSCNAANPTVTDCYFNCE